jgi:WD40 repeat protein
MRSKDQLVTASWDCTLRFWQLTEGRGDDDLFYERMIEHDSSVSALAVSEPNNILLFGDSEGQIQCYDIEFCSLKWTFKKYTQRVVFIKNHESNFLASLEHTMVLLNKMGHEIIQIYVPETNGSILDFHFMNNSIAAGTPLFFISKII